MCDKTIFVINDSVYEYTEITGRSITGFRSDLRPDNPEKSEVRVYSGGHEFIANPGSVIRRITVMDLGDCGRDERTETARGLGQFVEWLRYCLRSE